MEKALGEDWEHIFNDTCCHITSLTATPSQWNNKSVWSTEISIF